MKRPKLSLDLSSLAVESFDTLSERGHAPGTVHGADISDTTCYDQDCFCQTIRNCPTQDTCDTDCDCSGYDCTGIHSCGPPTCLYSCGHATCYGDTCAWYDTSCCA